MKFSVWPSFARPWSEAVEFARTCEAQGWHGLWYADHYMPDRPNGEVANDPALECFAVIAAFAAATNRLRLGTLVSPTTMHHPTLLAKRACTIDQISGGRFVLGMGAGWQVNEHRAYGVELFQPKARVDRFEEAIGIVHSMLRNDRTNHTGTHFTVTDAPCEPKPVQQTLPILVGTSGPRMSRIVARFAQEWNAWGTPETVSRAAKVMDAACEREARDPATMRRSAQALVFLVDSDATAEKIRKAAPADRSIIGTPAQVAETVAAYRESGVDEFIVPDFTMGNDASQRAENYARFWSEVVPAVG